MITYPNFDEILQVPGLLYWNPTNLSAEATWGTLLGYTEDGVHFEPGLNLAPIKKEETGEEITQMLYLGSSPNVTAILQNFNATVMSRLFPGMGGTTFAKAPGSYKAGKVLSGTSDVYGRLLFVPNDDANNPCLLLQKVVPNLVESAKLNFMHNNRLFFPINFTVLRKSNDADGMYYLGNISGAVLR